MKKNTRPPLSSVTAEESALFRESIGEITPIHYDKVSHPKRRIRSHHRKQPPLHAPHSPEELKKFDIQPLKRDKKVLRKLKSGQFPIDGKLDLHGKTQIQAELALKQFLEQAIYLGSQCILIVHGKGHNSSQHIPIIKETTRYILSQHPGVVAYASATAKHGGSGASYVLLSPNHNYL